VAVGIPAGPINNVSEAFAEDLTDAVRPEQAAPARGLRGSRLLLSVLPVMLVLAGAVALGLGVA
jgi:hypothetical protein